MLRHLTPRFLPIRYALSHAAQNASGCCRFFADGNGRSGF